MEATEGQGRPDCRLVRDIGLSSSRIASAGHAEDEHLLGLSNDPLLLHGYIQRAGHAVTPLPLRILPMLARVREADDRGSSCSDRYGVEEPRPGSSLKPEAFTPTDDDMKSALGAGQSSPIRHAFPAMAWPVGFGVLTAILLWVYRA